jgi:FlaA1/EpsC-like NDP-sugar epimerase
MRVAVLKARLLTRQMQLVADLGMLSLSFLFAYLLRFDFVLPRSVLVGALAQLPVVVLIQFAALAAAGVYSFIWRYVGMRELRAFIYAAAWSSLVLTTLRLTLPDPLASWRVPLSVIVMGTVLGFGGALSLRVLRRYLFERVEQRRRRPRSFLGDRQPTLFLGAGQAGVMAAREIEGRDDGELDVKGFVDDDPAKLGTVVHGLRVLGTTAELPRLVRELGITRVVITIAQISRPDILRLIELCQKIPVNVRIIPGLSEILEGRVKVTRIRDVKVEDLLGRSPVYLDETGVRNFIDGKTVMVTGAGGSIGSEMARQICRLRPAQLLLVERAEFALFDIDQELNRTLRAFHDLPVVPLVADVGDRGRMDALLSEYRPQVIFHAAAHKHVPMMEANVGEAVKNNTLATALLADLAGQHEVEAFILISTDKAVRPTSVMGASKRLAELAIQAAAQRHETRYLAVRFGNVIGSAGSVIPVFRDQIAQGGPVTVTHPEMKRYFMTIPEAAMLVLQAGAMGNGGEILVLEMGEQVRVLDLAVAMIKMSGLKPYEEMEIVFTGLRPGEKLFEELELAGEEFEKTRHPKVFIGNIAPLPDDVVREGLDRLEQLARDSDSDGIRKLMSELIPEARLEGVRRRRVSGSAPGRTGGAGPHAA